MSEARVKLARLIGDELAADVATIVSDDLPDHNQSAIEMVGDQPKLTEAVRAMLIMAGCDASYAKNHWVIRRSKISRDEEEAYARATLANRRKIKFQTALPVQSTFEDWRKAVNYLTDSLPKP